MIAKNELQVGMTLRTPDGHDFKIRKIGKQRVTFDHKVNRNYGYGNRPHYMSLTLGQINLYGYKIKK